MNNTSATNTGPMISSLQIRVLEQEIRAVSTAIF